MFDYFFQSNSPKIYVFGGINIDHFLDVKRFPYNGETVSTLSSTQTSLGGKALNTAIAIALWGKSLKLHSVELVGNVGREIVPHLKTLLKENGISYKLLTIHDDLLSSRAYVTRSHDESENQIIVDNETNFKLIDEKILVELQPESTVVLNLECGVANATRVLKYSKKIKCRTFVNFSPLMDLFDPQDGEPIVEIYEALLNYTDVMIVNESEYKLLDGFNSDKVLEHPLSIIVTRGPGSISILHLDPTSERLKKEHSVHHTRTALNKAEVPERLRRNLKLYETDCPDATGAGDCFLGTLVASGQITAAIVASGLSIWNSGCYQSYRDGCEVREFLALTARSSKDSLEDLISESTEIRR